MRTVGWFISWILSFIAYIIWIIRLPQLNSFLESMPDSFVVYFLVVIAGIVILVGGGLSIVGIWYLIWRPEL